jgi:hypothetical protein
MRAVSPLPLARLARPARLAAAAILSTTLFPALAHATLSQPDGTVIPTAPGCDGGKPTGLAATFACSCTTAGICNIGASCPGGSTSCDPGTNGTCETTLWHTVNDNPCIPTNSSGLDVRAEAATTPETFRPTCALTFKVLTRGTSQFKNVFGWYNVTGAKPDPSDLHVMLDCTATAGASVVLDLSKEPAYKGGEIGFFMLTPESKTTPKTCAGGDCCPSLARYGAGTGYVFYSQRAYNPDNTSATPFIHLLTYDSHLSKTKFYFAWEDLYSGGDNNFTDLVTSVDGVQCSGGGVRCDTGQKGACALGVTECSGGSVTCKPVLGSKAETCNGVDDDCNGKVDDGATCPKAGESCHDGKCVGPCGTGEFDCDTGKACDSATKLCVDKACVGKACPSDQVCRNGGCVKPCDGVVCPFGTQCINDQCVNLCAGVACGAGQVCRDGVCFGGCASCSGISCSAGLKCDGTSDDCVDPSCATSCAKGTHCKSGSCVDDCDGAKCPDGTVCAKGACVDPTVADAGPVLPDAGPTLDGGGDGGNGAAGDQPEAAACNCEAPGHATRGSMATLGALGGVVALAGVIARRRRRG